MIKDWISRYSWWWIIGPWVIALGLGILIPSTEIEPDVEAMIPDKMVSKMNTEQIEEVFGGSEMILLILENEDILDAPCLERLESLSDGFQEIPEIEKTISLFTLKEIVGESGMMRVTPAINGIPNNPEEKSRLIQSLQHNSIVNGVVVSDNLKYSAVLGTLQRDVDYVRVIEEIDSLVQVTPGPGKIYLGGYPVVNDQITRNIQKDLWFLLPIALILMILILWISFRDFKGVFLPFSVVVMSILVSMGLMPLFGWKIAMVTVLLPIMMIAIANNYGIHMVNRYQEIIKQRKDRPRKEVVALLLQSLGWPVILTALTTIAGILGLLTHVIVPAKQVGVLATIGIFWALILSLVYIPATLAIMKPGKHIMKIDPREGFSGRLLKSLARLITQQPVRTLMISLVITLFISVGLIKLRVEGNTINFFQPSDPVRISANIIDQYFGGSQTISIMFTGDILSPELLGTMDAYEEDLNQTPEVGQVMSIATVIRLISRTLLDPNDPGYDKIPDTREGVAQYLELYSMSGDPSDFEQLVDFNYENAQMIIRVKEESSSKVLGLVDHIKTLLKQDGQKAKIGGVGLISAELNDHLITGQRNSLIFALLVVSILIALIFRSFMAGLFSIIPLGIACLVLFGMMGWFGIPLDAATTLLSSVMIGVGVDYTIHFLWRFKAEKKAGLSSTQAVIETLTTTGKGIVYNAISVMAGFSVLLLSSFNPIRFFGFLVLISIFACLVGALIIIPALALVIKPKFLDPS